jgi:hypothetical protein
MTHKRAEEVRGYEYDWLATDAGGHAGIFSTAGGGYVPPEVLRDLDAHYAAIALLMSLPESCVPASAPTMSAAYINSWAMAAARGLFAFDGDFLGGPYRLVGVPTTPIRASALPDAVARVANRVTFTKVRFQGQSLLQVERAATLEAHAAKSEPR